MELKFFFKQGCPYCKCANEVIAELFSEHPEYAKLPLERIDEENPPDLHGKKYDYWYVPTFFLNDKKMYEAQPGDDAPKMKKILGNIFAQMAK